MKQGLRRLTAGENLTDHADVIIIGGGATGVGLLWDLTLRGFDVVLIEQAGLGSGTSGAFHGLLHSGGRYAGSDPETAAECLVENRILKAVAAPFVHDTGGLFIRLEEDDREWERQWLDGCRRAGLRPEGVSLDWLNRQEPHLADRVVSAYQVPDAAVDGFGLLWSLVWAATERGARAYFRARVTGFLTDDDGVCGVNLVGLGGTEEEAAGRVEDSRVEPGEVRAPVVINATGPWASDTAALAGPGVAEAVPVLRDKGVMIIFNTLLTRRVVNRLRPPSDGDIFVPHGPVTIFGTTAGSYGGSGRPQPSTSEVARLMEEGRTLLPGLDRAAPLRAYAGVRPLVASRTDSAAPREELSGRGRGRRFLLVDHEAAGGPVGLVTVAGGKFTTFRAMAEAAGDLVCGLLGRKRPSRTTEVGVPRLKAARTGTDDLAAPLGCECEFVSKPRLEALIEAGLALPDLRRIARVGMGSCQGVFCTRRLAGFLVEAGWPGDRHRPQADPEAISRETEDFLRARESGVRSVEWGAGARLSALAGALENLTLGGGGS